MSLFHRKPKTFPFFDTEKLQKLLPGARGIDDNWKIYDDEKAYLESLVPAIADPEAVKIPERIMLTNDSNRDVEAACVLELPHGHSIHVICTGYDWVVAAAPGLADFPEGLSLYVPRKKGERARENPESAQAQDPSICMYKVGGSMIPIPCSRTWNLIPIVSDDPKAVIAALTPGMAEGETYEDRQRKRHQLHLFTNAVIGPYTLGCSVTRAGVVAAGKMPHFLDFETPVEAARHVAALVEPESEGAIPKRERKDARRR